MCTSDLKLQLATSRQHAETQQLVLPSPSRCLRLVPLTGQIKHCVSGMLPVLFSSIPCKLTAINSRLRRPSQRDPITQVPLSGFKTLRPHGSVSRELRTFNELASLRS